MTNPVTNLNDWKNIKKLQQQKKDLTVLVKTMTKFKDVAEKYYMYKGMQELLVKMNDLQSYYTLHVDRINRALEQDE